MKEPRISVSTPSFNQAPYIEQCIRSVQEQDYPDVEHIIFDGGSTDGTLDVLRRYDGVVRWKSEPDKGQSDAINKGFRAATGDIVGWINSDDWYCRGAFRAVADYFATHPETDFVYGNNLFTDADGQVLRRYRTMPYRWEWLLWTGLLIPQPGFFVRRSVLADCGLVDVALHNVMDFEWWLRIARKHPPHFIDRYLAFFRVHANSLSGSGRLDHRWHSERWTSQQKHAGRPLTPWGARVARTSASVSKTLLRLARELTGPRDFGLHCVPCVVVLKDELEPSDVERFNALHAVHNLEIQVWSQASLAGANKPAWLAGARFACRSLADARMWMAGRSFKRRRFTEARGSFWRRLWLERPDAVVLARGSGGAGWATLYRAVCGAPLIEWDGRGTADGLLNAILDGLRKRRGAIGNS